MDEQELRRVVDAATDRALDSYRKRNKENHVMTPDRRKEIAQYYREYAEQLANGKH